MFGSVLAVLLAVALGWMLLGGGANPIAVPNVEGKSQSAATDQLDAAGLKVKVREVNVADAKAGEVVRQTPEAGAEVDRGSVVTLSVATGRVDIPVDKLIGATYEEAAAMLDQLGLEPVPAFAASDKPTGTVIGVDPAKTAKIGSTVTLTVALGPAEQNQGNDKGNSGKGKGDEKPDKDKDKDNDDDDDSTQPTSRPTATTTPTPDTDDSTP